MPKLISKVTADRSYRTGRLSTGADAQVVAATGWIVTALDDDGRVQSVEFDHDPSAQEILNALAKPAALVPTAKADWEVYIRNVTYPRWSIFHATRLEMEVRNFPTGSAAQIAGYNAAVAQENALWSDHLAALNSWRLAT